MAIAFIDGFESYGIVGTNGSTLETNLGTVYTFASDVENGGNNFEIATGRVGGKCLKVQRNSATLEMARAMLGITSRVVFGFAFKVDLTATQYLNQVTFFQLGGGTNGSLLTPDSANISLAFKVGGPIQIRTSYQSTILGFTDIPIKEGTWYYLEGKAYSHSSAGTLELRLNGATVANLTGINTAAGGVGFSGFRWGCGSDYYIDDFYFIDDVGGTPDFLGPLMIEDIRPSGDDSVQWTPSAGSNYQCVDDVSLTTSDYVSSSTVNHTDVYAYENLSSIDTGVKAAQINTCARLSANGGQHVLQSLCDSNGDIVTQNVGLVSVSKNLKPQLVLTDPDTSIAWTVSGINAAKFGIKVVS